MLRTVFACLFACSSAALAKDSEPVQVWLDPGFFSYHLKEGNYRQDNYGFGVGVFVAPEHGFLAGTFLNSNDERSHYAAYHWRPWGRTTAGVSVRAWRSASSTATRTPTTATGFRSFFLR